MDFETLSDMYEPNDPKLYALLHEVEDIYYENPSYGPGNPDWEYDREREDNDV
jgi:hypothetical protein